MESFSAPSHRELQLYDTIHHQQEKPIDVAASYFTSPNDVSIDPKGSKIIEFFQGKHVFLTGGTGFVGILTVEKLLRACPGIERIYLLLRNKRNKTVPQRVEQYFQNEVFEPLSKLFPNFKDKVTIINGDVSQPNLGISPEDRQLLTKNVQIIIHGAATVSFEAPFRTAITINAIGSKQMLKLAEECPKLVSYVHISTAFSTPYQIPIKEVVHEYTGNIQELFDALDRYSDEELVDISKKFLKDFPNNYAFSKNIAECITKEHMDHLPISIFRPSMILSTYREPLRGWTNNIYGPLGITLAGGIGLEHIILASPSAQGHNVPADYVVNGLIACCYKNSLNRGKIYNFVSRPCAFITWREMTRRCEDHTFAACGIKTLMPIFMVTLTTNQWLFKFVAFFLHTVPAYVLDALAKVTGQQEKIKLSDAVAKMHHLMFLVIYYNKRQWIFDFHNVDELWTDLSIEDRNAFPFNIREVSWNLYIINLLFGLRTYIMKDKISTLPAARKRLEKINKIWYTIAVILLVLLFIAVNYLFNFVKYYAFTLCPYYK